LRQEHLDHLDHLGDVTFDKEYLDDLNDFETELFVTAARLVIVCILPKLVNVNAFSRK